MSAAVPEPRSGPPPLRPFGLVLHHDGSWTHEGQPVRHERLRSAFDRGVRFLPEEGKFVVQLGRFRGEVEVEEAAFFVREVDAGRGELLLSDGRRAPLRPETLHLSPIDGAWLCRVEHEGAPEGLLARFRHAAQAELMERVEPGPEGPCLRWQGRLHALGLEA